MMSRRNGTEVEFESRRNGSRRNGSRRNGTNHRRNGSRRNGSDSHIIGWKITFLRKTNKLSVLHTHINGNTLELHDAFFTGRETQ